MPESAHAFSGLVYRQIIEMRQGLRDEPATRALIVRENLQVRPASTDVVPQGTWRMMARRAGDRSGRAVDGAQRCPRLRAPCTLNLGLWTLDPGPMITRVLAIVMDSVGCGELPDARTYGDEGSDTLGHIADAVPLRVPTLRSLGLAQVARIGGDRPAPIGAAGRMAEASPGKDSVTGHWELMGIVLDRPFPTFPDGFSGRDNRRIRAPNRPPIDWECRPRAPGIIDSLGAEHMRTGAPIVYTSADSVFQIAAHEGVVPIEELYRYCDEAFDLVGRGMGCRPGHRPTIRRRAWSLHTHSKPAGLRPRPVRGNRVDRLKAAGHPVVGIGKIDDLFASRGLTRAVHTCSDDHGMDVVLGNCRRPIAD